MPKVTERYIRIPVADKHDGDDVRNISISTKEGIRALWARNRRTILTYMFARSYGWSMDTAKKWTDNHDKNTQKKIFKGGKVEKGYGRDVDHLLSILDEDDPLFNELENLLMEAAQKGWDDGFSDVNAADNTVLPPSALQEVREKALALSKLINDSLKQTIAEEIIEGYNEGRKLSDTAQEIKKLIDAPFKIKVEPKYDSDGNVVRQGYTKNMSVEQWADITSRTETQAVGTTSMIESYKQAGFKEGRFFANPGACELCQPYDGKVFPLDDLKALLPLHANCRCVPLAAVRKQITNNLYEGMMINGIEVYL